MTRHTSSWIAMASIGTLLLAPCSVAGELQVEYQASRLSVTAADVSLHEVLRAIGAKVGFTVADAGGSSQPVTLSLEDAAVDDVLRQLLRSQNHTILYRHAGSAEVVDRIVLLGLPGERGLEVASVPSTPPVAAARPPAVGPGAGAAPAAGAPADQDEVTVGEMLRSHALSGVPAQAVPQSDVAESPAQGAGSPGAAGGPPATAAGGVPPGLEASLAETTRRAQQGLSSLVESLQRATESLQQAPAAPAATPAPGR